MGRVLVGTTLPPLQLGWVRWDGWLKSAHYLIGVNQSLGVGSMSMGARQRMYGVRINIGGRQSKIGPRLTAPLGCWMRPHGRTTLGDSPKDCPRYYAKAFH